MITPQLRPLAPLSGSMTYQHVLEDSGPTDSHSDDYQSLLYAPFISAILSAAVLLIHYYLHDLDLRRSLSSGTVRKKTRSTTRPTRAQRSINIWKVLRLGVCLILLLLAIVMLGMAESCPNPDNAKPGATDQVASALAGHGIGKRKKRQHHTNLCLTKEQSTRLSLACFYQTYTTLLAFLTLCLGPEFNAACDSHITPLLLLALLVDIWVQIFPGREMSKATLICDWVRIGFLAIASIITPILAWSSSPTNKYKTPPTNWPTSGRLVVQNLTAQYSDQEPPTIEDISFRVSAGDRIGIVGKLASQLRALLLVLGNLGLTTTLGYNSGVGTHTIHPTILSSHISLITGQAASSSSRATVRYVLDPQHQYSNETLYAALNTAGLVGFGLEIGLKRISARAQYGVGFAAAVVSGGLSLFMVEYAPDTEFHASLRCALPNATILVITNTLRNIRGVDKVLVLEAGHLAELGTPSELLNRHGAFRKLVDVDDARDALYVRATPIETRVTISETRTSYPVKSPNEQSPSKHAESAAVPKTPNILGRSQNWSFGLDMILALDSGLQCAGGDDIPSLRLLMTTGMHVIWSKGNAVEYTSS
ncbi:hypothetical protein AG1IA_03003 [Rhizoctonia solani AG-1 IA]|uniref:Uncharacterized protein n=1 Tax=Thanatephorus cucumeris (strain AG1-IA) TaxID=983506 RepID=L8X1S7_THACA|nr:hypothetical protein AG1IA_03003 [Rhizoctonia solani AG-1 IA]